MINCFNLSFSNIYPQSLFISFLLLSSNTRMFYFGTCIDCHISVQLHLSVGATFSCDITSSQSRWRGYILLANHVVFSHLADFYTLHKHKTCTEFIWPFFLRSAVLKLFNEKKMYKKARNMTTAWPSMVAWPPPVLTEGVALGVFVLRSWKRVNGIF